MQNCTDTVKISAQGSCLPLCQHSCVDVQVNQFGELRRVLSRTPWDPWGSDNQRYMRCQLKVRVLSIFGMFTELITYSNTQTQTQARNITHIVTRVR